MSIPSTMRAIEIRDGKLAAAELPVPQPNAGELLIRVAYAGVNRADALQVAGQYAPPDDASPLPGLEVSGTVAALGDGVKGFAIGQKVCALLSGGGYAEYATAPATQTLALPGNLSLAEAATLPEAAATSIMALLDSGHLTTGERVLIHGGASNLGILMTQIARSWGAEVFATVGGAEKAALMQSLGVTPIDHRIAPFPGQLMQHTRDQGVDVIIDTLGGPQLEAHLRLLRPGGRLVTLAMLEGSTVGPFKMTRLLLNHLSWTGTTLRSKTHQQKAFIMEMVGRRIWPKLVDGSIKPVIDSVFPLFDAEKAHLRMQERLHMGKILLEVTAN